MKNQLVLFVIVPAFVVHLSAQIYPPSAYLNVNNMKALIRSEGSLYYDSAANVQGLEVPKNDGTSIAFAGGLWVGGIRLSDSTVQTIANKWYYDNLCFSTGPVAQNYMAAGYQKFKRLWKLDQSTVSYHRLNYNSTGYMMDSTILNWPAHGDTNNGEARYLAPFTDINYNGIYEPQIGDYPCIKGDQAIYIMYNSENCFYGNMRAEFHLMAYAFHTNNHVDNAIFLEYKIINRSTDSYGDLVVAKWTDMDIGGSDDDYIGCDTNTNLLYTYNGDNFDAPSLYLNGFGNNPPAAGIKLLNRKAHAMMYFNRTGGGGYNKATTPIVSSDYYNYMNAKWKDSSHLVVGGNGYPSSPGATAIHTNFAFPGDPLDTNTWVEKYSPYDRNLVISTKFQSFAPNDYLEVTYAIIYASDTNINNLHNVNVLKTATNFVQDFYDSNNYRCTFFATSIEEENSQRLISIYPNPAKDQLNFKVENGKLEMVEFYNNLGQMVLSQRINGLNTFEMNVSDLPRSMYFVRLTLDGETVVRRVMLE